MLRGPPAQGYSSNLTAGSSFLHYLGLCGSEAALGGAEKKRSLGKNIGTGTYLYDTARFGSNASDRTANIISFLDSVCAMVTLDRVTYRYAALVIQVQAHFMSLASYVESSGLSIINMPFFKSP